MGTHSKLYALLYSEIKPSETILFEGIRGGVAKLRLFFTLLGVVATLLAIVTKAYLAALTIIAATVLGIMWTFRPPPRSILYAETDIRVLEVTMDGARTLATHEEIDKITDSLFKVYKKVSFTNGLAPIQFLVERPRAAMLVTEKLDVTSYMKVDPDKPTSIKDLKDQIELWMVRAQMAFEQRNSELAATALHRKFLWQCRLAALEGTPPPESPESADALFGAMPDVAQTQHDSFPLPRRPDEPDQDSSARR